jgi:parallel beta-helix repeat protein
MSTYNLSVDIDPTDLAVSLGNVTNISAEVTLRGPIGATGATGAAGQGLASGGTTGQYLRKSSSTNYDTGWDTVTSSDITDFDSQVRTSRLDQMAIPTTDVNLNSNKISNLTDPSADQDAATKKYVDDHAGSGGGGSTSSFDVTQTAHGFVVGDVLRNAGTANTYAKAQADSAAHAEIVGIVTVVTDANTFSVTTQGIVTTGVPAATAGTVMFLSASTAGALSSTEPSSLGDVSKPLAIVLESSVRMLFSNFRGELINSSSGGGGGAGTISVEEVDGAPAVTDVSTIRVTNGTLTDDGSGQVTIDTGGSGDASGPASSTDNAIARFDSTTGKLLQNSTPTITDGGIISNVTDPSSAQDAATKNYADKMRTATFTVGMTGSGADYICDGTADDIQIQQALTAISVLGGGSLFIREGTYDITANMSTPSNTIIQGAGWSTKLKMSSGVNLSSIFSCLSKSNVVYRDMELDGNKTNQTGPQICTLISASQGNKIIADNIYAHDSIQQGIYWGGVTNCVIKNCYGYNNGGIVLPNGRLEGFGFGFNESGTTPSTNNLITNCRADSNYEGGYSIYSGGTYISRNNVISNCIASNMSSSPAVAFNIFSNTFGPTSNSITGCSVYNCYVGVQISGYAPYNEIVNNNIYQTTFVGIYIHGSARNTLVSNNIVRKAGNNGITIDSSRYASILNNVITGCSSNGISIATSDFSNIANNNCYVNGQDGIRLTNTDNSIVSSNYCLNNSQNTLGANYGIQLATSGSGSTRNIVNNNWCTDNQVSTSLSALSASASSGQAIVTVSDATLFWVSQKVTCVQGATTENLVISSINNATSEITMTTNLTNSYTTAASLKGRTGQRYGIFESDSTTDLNLIYGNICRNNANGQIVINGASTQLSHNITT